MSITTTVTTTNRPPGKLDSTKAASKLYTFQFPNMKKTSAETNTNIYI